MEEIKQLEKIIPNETLATQLEPCGTRAGGAKSAAAKPSKKIRKVATGLNMSARCGVITQ